MSEVSAIIFDLDGVIVDTAKYHFIAWRKLANELGFDFDEHQNEALKGVSRMKSLDMILDIGSVIKTQEEKELLAHNKNEHYQSLIAGMDQSELLPGVKELIEEVKSSGLKCVLGSASKNARKILEYVDLLQYFDAIVDGTNVTKAKPDPEVFIQGADLVKAPYTSTIVIEDAIAGVQAANQVDMYTIGIGDPEILHEADWVIKNFKGISLSDIIEKYKERNS